MRRLSRSGRTLEPLHERLPLLHILTSDVALHLVHSHPLLSCASIVLGITDRRDYRNPQCLQEADQRLVGEGVAPDAVGNDADPIVLSPYLRNQQQIADGPRTCMDIDI